MLIVHCRHHTRVSSYVCVITVVCLLKPHTKRLNKRNTIIWHDLCVKFVFAVNYVFKWNIEKQLRTTRYVWFTFKKQYDHGVLLHLMLLPNPTVLTLINFLDSHFFESRKTINCVSWQVNDFYSMEASCL